MGKGRVRSRHRPFPTISGETPLEVRFNLCRSDDPDPEDSLNSGSRSAASASEPFLWVNADGSTHTATADAGAFDTGFIAPGATSGGVSPPTGTFPYHCGIHPSMVATLTVQP